MQYIDERFKDCSPQATVERIQGILRDLDIPVKESWNDSGLENCHSVHLSTLAGTPGYNGKGVTRDFARASAHAEFLERLQSGLYLSKYQSIMRDREMDLHAYAPDARYMTVDELVAEGEWMDYIIESCKNPMITRQSIAEHCRAYDCADDGKILTTPYYSLFEGKYVYLPSAFVTRIYTANGNCAGNSREEAWIHALSEIMERYASLNVLVSGGAVPQISEESLSKFPTVMNMIKQIRENGDYDVAVFDYSMGLGMPVVATRIINKENQSYIVNAAADPVFEIAVQRTFTELFQGRDVRNFHCAHHAKILNKITDFPLHFNMLNQVQTSNGMYTADFFANELTCQQKPAQFPDNSNKSNPEILEFMLDIYKKMGRPVYVRNLSYLGFHSYKFVVPGFSETRAIRLHQMLPEYAVADSARDIFKNAPAASDEDLQWMLNYAETTKGIYGLYNSFSSNAGLPLAEGSDDAALSYLTRAYACYRLKKYRDAIANVKHYIYACHEEDAGEYFACVAKYIEMKNDGIAEDKIRVILYKFFIKDYADRLYEKLDNGQTPFDDYLVRCDLHSCKSCRYQKVCNYHYLKELTAKAGNVYKTFVNGQDPSEFALN